MLRRTVAKLRSREFTQVDLENLQAGYYQTLLNEGARVANAGLANPAGGIDASAQEGLYAPGGFLGWKFWPSASTVSRDGRSRLITNRFGMADRDYSLEKAPGTRRIALLGDSIVRGWGIATKDDFEELLEDRLNSVYRDANIQKFEILNFAVDNYTITQHLDVARETVPPYKPDVYVVSFTDLTVFRKWGNHIGLLVHRRADLKYDYLKRLAREADLKASDTSDQIQAKLAPYRIPTLRWALGELKAHRSEERRPLILLLVPSVSDAALVRTGFQGAYELGPELGIPVIDLTDTFQGVEDMSPYRISGVDRHPNEQGHRKIFENLYAKLLANPALFKLLVGKQPSAVPPPAKR
ncbi:MAG: SGNH/GDSL hydrolase family protein [Acidobacteria bacterium]|nr:SGNH/GDSL hydrolase family protein [Acidobacteriota bacterium]